VEQGKKNLTSYLLSFPLSLKTVSFLRTPFQEFPQYQDNIQGDHRR